MKRLIISLVAVLWYVSVHADTTEKPLVVVIASYNNEQWCEQNLASVYAQNYSNYRILYINDASRDTTKEKVLAFCAQQKKSVPFELIDNEHRRGAMENFYRAISSCKDEEIILILDGDDWFAHENVMSYINDVYSRNDVWITYGQYKEYPNGVVGFCQDFPRWVVENNAFRRFENLPMSHLRTFYAGLFKKVAVEDFLDEAGNFLSMTCDKAMMAPMIEMAGERYKCIPDVLVIYNNSNPISDHRVNHRMQLQLMHYVLGKKPYTRLSSLFN